MTRPEIDQHVRRRLEAVVAARLEEEPVIVLQGPRAVGKSTLLRHVATARGVEVIDLDDPRVRDAFRSNTDAFLSLPSPVCVDEYQHAPELLDAIKARLNRSSRPGVLLLTGSARYQALPLVAQSLTGRLHVITVRPLSQGEVSGKNETFLEALLRDAEGALGAASRAPRSLTSRTDYIQRIVAGGMPMPLRRHTDAARARWFDDYVQLVLERDVLELARVRQREQLPRLLARLAGQTGQVLNLSRAAESIGLEPSTAEHYATLLESVFLLYRLPAWGTTLRARAAARPKLHMMDSGLAARLLRLTPARLAKLDPTALSELGHLMETFAVSELLKQASWLEYPVASGHWRTHDGDEVDAVFERDDGSIVAFEVKAGDRVPGDALKGLQKLREAAGQRFLAGIALYTGERAYAVDDRIHVVPIDRLWH